MLTPKSHTFIQHILHCSSESLLGPQMQVQHMQQRCFSAYLTKPVLFGCSLSSLARKQVYSLLLICIWPETCSSIVSNCNSLKRTWAGTEEGVPGSQYVRLAGFLGDLYSAVHARGYVERSFIQFIELQPARERSFMVSFLNVTVLKMNSLMQNCAPDYNMGTPGVN